MAFLASFLIFGAMFLQHPLVSKCDHQIKTYTYYRSDVRKTGTSKVPSNVLSVKTLVECAVITSIVSEMSFYFKERPVECIVEKEETNYLTDPFESEFVRFVAGRKGKNPESDRQIDALYAMSSQPPQTKALTREDHDEDFWNSIPVPKSLLENPPPDGEFSYPKATETEQPEAMATLPTNKGKSLAEELLEKTKQLLDSTNVIP